MVPLELSGTYKTGDATPRGQRLHTPEPGVLDVGFDNGHCARHADLLLGRPAATRTGLPPACYDKLGKQAVNQVSLRYRY